MAQNVKLRDIFQEKLEETVIFLKKTHYFMKIFCVLQEKLMFLLNGNWNKLEEVRNFKEENFTKLINEHQKHAKKMSIVKFFNKIIEILYFL